MWILACDRGIMLKILDFEAFPLILGCDWQGLLSAFSAVDFLKQKHQEKMEELASPHLPSGRGSGSGGEAVLLSTLELQVV